jgi:hypothetical protein
MFGRGEYSQWFPTVRFTDKRFSTTVKSAKKTVISPECLSVFVPCDFIVQAFPFSFNFLAAEKIVYFQIQFATKMSTFVSKGKDACFLKCFVVSGRHFFANFFFCRPFRKLSAAENLSKTRLIWNAQEPN